VSAPHCKTCGEQIRKLTTSYTFREPREGREAGFRNLAGFGPVQEPAIAAKVEGEREQSTPYSWTIYTATRPRTRAEAQRLVNHPVASISRSPVDGTISSFTAWEGDYEDAHFCTNKCAERFGRAFAMAGHTLTRKIPK
jgi:hypothetical protein